MFFGVVARYSFAWTVAVCSSWVLNYLFIDGLVMPTTEREVGFSGARGRAIILADETAPQPNGLSTASDKYRVVAIRKTRAVVGMPVRMGKQRALVREGLLCGRT
jgi:hypothetical protein